MTPFEPNTGDWAVITGAGRGIGRWLAQHFAAKGMRVCALDSDAYEAEETARLCGASARAHGCDVSDRAETERVAEKLIAMGVEPALLWINAGVATADTIIEAKARQIAQPAQGQRRRGTTCGRHRTRCSRVRGGKSTR